MAPHAAELTVASFDEALRLARVMRDLRALGGGRPSLEVLGADDRSVPSDGAELLVLPGAGDLATATARAVTRCVVGDPRGTAIVVPGAGRLDSRGRYVLSASAHGRLRAAEALVASCAGVPVILSGWSGGHRGSSEAEQLQDAWSGPAGTPLVLDTAARTTAENAVNAVRLATALGSCRELIFVAPWSNAVRQGLLVRAAARGSGLRTRQHVIWGRAHLRSLRPGITGLFFMRRHLRAARARVRDVGADR